MTRKFDQYKGVRDIITKIREMVWNSNLKDQLFSDDDNDKFGWEVDPLGRFLPYLSELSDQLKKDLSKVEFDWENYTSATDLVDQAWRSRHPHIKDEFGYSLNIMGPHNRMGAEGVSWIGCAAGGDWEEPVFFMLYMADGRVRAWIPKDGNCWNRATKQAFGNDEDADVADIKKQLQNIRPELTDEDDDSMLTYSEYLRDSDKILQGIQTHFVPLPHKPKR